MWLVDVFLSHAATFVVLKCSSVAIKPKVWESRICQGGKSPLHSAGSADKDTTSLAIYRVGPSDDTIGLPPQANLSLYYLNVNKGRTQQLTVTVLSLQFCVSTSKVPAP